MEIYANGGTPTAHRGALANAQEMTNGAATKRRTPLCRTFLPRGASTSHPMRVVRAGGDQKEAKQFKLAGIPDC